MAGAWSCPHEENGLCNKVAQKPCDPGMKGCVLAGRYAFFNGDEKNERLRVKRAREAAENTTGKPAPQAPDAPDSADSGNETD